MDIPRLLLKNGKIYVPLANDFCTYILQYHHDHIFIGHFRQNKILELIHCSYTWPFLYADVKKFCNSCLTCIRFKPWCHKLYRIFKQLPIPRKSWNFKAGHICSDSRYYQFIWASKTICNPYFFQAWCFVLYHF